MAVANIVNETQHVIAAHTDYITSVNFINLIKRSRAGVLLETPDAFTETEQITMINNFWRNHLGLLPNTLEIRVWLCEGDDIMSYINSFENNWLALVLATGLLNTPIS
jgi:hypothetical protein